MIKSLYMKSKKQISVAVGLSGGVDSAVTAALLKDQGYNVIGVHMLRWDDDIPGCTGSVDRQDALKVAKHLNIPFRTVDFQNEYKNLVVDRYLSEIEKGFSPNPDIWCNEFLKFGVCMDYALNTLGVDKIATGHYARIEYKPPACLPARQGFDGGFVLRQGVDKTKDQSYFLYRLSQDQLSHALFPLGGLTKKEVRGLAQTYGLHVAHKKDSVGICFIGDIDVREFIKEHVPVFPGMVVDIEGNEIGYHQGIQLYTVGQRSGFTLTSYKGEPLYVVKKDQDRNVLVVGRGTDSDVGELVLTEVVAFCEATVSTKLWVRIRHLGELSACKTSLGQNGNVTVTLAEPIRGVSPGQHAVFYDEQSRVLGGGVISSTY